ncbi:hypothetical protein ACIBCN_44270 [Nocardia sp. NPDC051052]|uniref:hypothetical protein n=1 Tax=Nocardia sp. NPDC051052 TaxID=3364322 RepID=UPI00379D9D46
MTDDRHPAPEILPPSDESRLSVNINNDTESILRAYMDIEKASATEAVGRLIAYGEIVWEACLTGNEIVLKGGKIERRVVVQIDDVTPHMTKTHPTHEQG